jgi:ApbE superfamily uncharacterized protein (UPF0280 family)
VNSPRYSERFYRKWQKPPDLQSFHIQRGETDLQIYAESDISRRAGDLIELYRSQIEQTILAQPEFQTSLTPIHLNSPYSIVNRMVEKSSLAGVGPMAGVAGAIAEFVGISLLPYSAELIVENGGDLFIRSKKKRIILVYAGEYSPFSGGLRIVLHGRADPYGVCTSSASIGHSLSLGKTDAAVILAGSAVTADTFATAVGNMVQNETDIERGLSFVRSHDEIFGALIVVGDRLGIWGELELAD